MTTKKGLAVQAETECLAHKTAIKVAALAQRWECDRSTITRMINDGTLPAFPVGKSKSGKPHYRVVLAAVLRMESDANQAPPVQRVTPWRGRSRRNRMVASS